MAVPTNERVHKRRERLRAAGLRPIQVWIPDTRQPGFAGICRSQAQMTAAADRVDADLDTLLDVALDDLDPDAA